MEKNIILLSMTSAIAGAFMAYLVHEAKKNKNNVVYSK